MKISDADKIYSGSTPVERVYSGADLVWPTAAPISIAPINVHYSDPTYVNVDFGQKSGWWYWGVMLPPNEEGFNGEAHYRQNGFDAWDQPLSSSGKDGQYGGSSEIIETIDGIDYQLFLAANAVSSTGGYLLQIRGGPTYRTDYPDYSDWIRILWDGTSPPGEEPVVSDLLPQDITNYIPGG